MANVFVKYFVIFTRTWHCCTYTDHAVYGMHTVVAGGIILVGQSLQFAALPYVILVGQSLQSAVLPYVILLGHSL